MLRRAVLKLGAGAAWLLAANRATAETCGAGILPFAQLTYGSLQNGVRTVLAVRTTEAGTLELAEWRYDTLIGAAALALGAGDLHARLRALAERVRTPIFSGNPTVPGRVLEAGLAESGRLRAAITTDPPPGTDDLLAAARALAGPTAPDKGAWLWSKPATQAPVTDLDLRHPCAEPVATALAGALARGRLLVPVADPDTFFTGARVRRREFIARTQAGPVAFGIVRS